MLELARKHARPGRRARLVDAVDARFAAARFPFRHDRLIPRLTVAASVGDVRIEPGFRTNSPSTEKAKRALIARGYELADRELRKADDLREAAGLA